MLQRRGVSYHIVVPGVLVTYLQDFSITKMIKEKLPGFITYILEGITGDTKRAYSSMQFLGASFGALKYSLTLASPTLSPGSELSAVVAQDLSDFLQLTLRRQLRAEGRTLLNFVVLNTLQVVEQQDLFLL
ncbi:ORF2 protein [Human adenovirus 54]|uniref:14.5 kDa protein n=1 Tax=Human adenovirus 54 TaxID=651580 RepID=B9A5P7_9ADEN|nr:14.5 kDa protein [Human adenovirus 54]BAH18911.1 14.5kDa protein [Human adenovirus 54]BAH84818.1 14.5 kDa protein [Human adenovirus 54]BAX64541.1 ORF2 protein [Human adenovirus 54]BAX64693.1 ORF2 protein [Human adenovirus 54]BAX65415.1 ORF2 protein [Human adenovirus 54]